MRQRDLSIWELPTYLGSSRKSVMHPGWFEFFGEFTGELGSFGLLCSISISEYGKNS